MIAGLWECHVCGGLHRTQPLDAVMVKTLKGRAVGEACSQACAVVLYDPSQIVCEPLQTTGTAS